MMVSRYEAREVRISHQKSMGTGTGGYIKAVLNGREGNLEIES